MEKQYDKKSNKKLAAFRRIVIEIDFIVFLFYSNLLMGEFNRSGAGRQHGFLWALNDILTVKNFAIALTAAFIGHLVFGFLRNRKW